MREGGGGGGGGRGGEVGKRDANENVGGRGIEVKHDDSYVYIEDHGTAGLANHARFARSFVIFRLGYSDSFF